MLRTSPGVFALLLACTAVCLGAVAYAAAPHGPARPASISQAGSSGAVPRPSITQHPNKMAVSTSAKFGFKARGEEPRFQCRLDGRAWSACRSPVAYSKLAAGSHGFSVRTVAKGGRHSRAARFSWRLLEPQGFAIHPQLAGIGALYPGAPPVPLPLTIANPNPVPILVTGLQVRATADPAGCASAENLILSGSSASSAAPLKVPPSGSVSLPAPGISAPSIQLRDLPVNQDACQRTQFPLAFSGTARG
jgi:hypothetical protein